MRIIAERTGKPKSLADANQGNWTATISTDKLILFKNYTHMSLVSHILLFEIFPSIYSVLKPGLDFKYNKKNIF
jgi:hypothetical protein